MKTATSFEIGLRDVHAQNCQTLLCLSEQAVHGSGRFESLYDNGSASQCGYMDRVLVSYFFRWLGAQWNHKTHGDASTIELMMHLVHLAEYVFAEPDAHCRVAVLK